VRGHVNKRSTWQFVVDLGPQPLQRCPTCRKRYWTEQKRLKRCPQCHGPLEDRCERRQEFHTGYKSKREAEAELAKVLGSLALGMHIEPSKVLVAEFLRHEWLPAIRPTIRPTTYASYEGHVERHIIPALGQVPLQQLGGAQLNGLYARLLAEGRGPGKGGLSPATVRRVHATLHRAFKDAVRWNKIPRSPAEGADPPRAAGFEHPMQVWGAKELKIFLAAESESRAYPLWLLLATTGARRGEALGLTWDDLDLKAGRLAVRKTRVQNGYDTLLSTPKTRKGRRLIALDPATTRALRIQRVRQKKECRSQAVLWDPAGYVFTGEDGEPYHPERVSKMFRRASKKAGLPPIRLHDLRHSYATLALGAGVHPKIVSERLGHANIGITLDCYSHVLPVISEEAAWRVAALVLPD
jgi:integrase